MDSDLDANVARIESLGGTRPRSFAFPFGANAVPTNDSRTPDQLASLVEEEFTISFLASSLDRSTTVRAGWTPQALPRLTITRDLTAADLIRRLGRMMRPPPPRALSTARWEDTGGGRCGAGTGAVTAVAEPGEAVVSCRSTGSGPFASPAEISTTVHLPSDRATGLIGFASKTRAIEVAVGDQDVELRARTAEDGWEVLEVGSLDAFSSDVAVRLTVVDGVATATVGSVRLTSEVPTDDAAGHLRLDAVVLGSESAGGRSGASGRSSGWAPGWRLSTLSWRRPVAPAGSRCP